MSFVACPGLQFPEVDDMGRLRPEDAELLRRKIELIFQIAVKNGHTAYTARLSRSVGGLGTLRGRA